MLLYPVNTKNIRKSSHTARVRIAYWKRDIIGTMPSVTSFASGASSGIGGIILQMQAKSCKWSIYVCACTNRYAYTINKKARIRKSMDKRRDSRWGGGNNLILKEEPDCQERSPYQKRHNNGLENGDLRYESFLERRCVYHDEDVVIVKRKL